MRSDEVPVLLLGFNRPDKVAQVLEPLRIVRPRRVFVSVDGPRPDRAEDELRCVQTREAFDMGIDWPCEVQRLYRDTNLGCRRAVAGAISWVYSQVEECVIIEDDCVISPDFMEFCGVVLDRHREDERVMAVVAANFQNGAKRGDGDYYSSKYAHCWGWATWRRAWEAYEDDLSQLEPVVRGDVARQMHRSEDEQTYWQLVFDRCRAGEVDSWAYRWLFSCWKRRGISLIPGVNLVQNQGFSADGTHTTEGDSSLGSAGSLSDFGAPSTLEPDVDADDYTFRQVFCPPLSHAERQVLHHRIKALKTEIKQVRERCAILEKAAKEKPRGLKRLFGGSTSP